MHAPLVHLRTCKGVLTAMQLGSRPAHGIHSMPSGLHVAQWWGAYLMNLQNE